MCTNAWVHCWALRYLRIPLHDTCASLRIPAHPCASLRVTCAYPPAGGRTFSEMAFRATGVGTAPHTGTYSFGAKEY
ncbi:MAG: hypothetical protein RSD76_04760, partial [Clostridia bacterium]